MTGNRGPEPEEMSPEDRHLAVTVDRRLKDEAGIYAAVRVGAGVAYLDGIVDSAAQRDAASDLAAGVAGIARVQNDLDVEEEGIPYMPPTDPVVRPSNDQQELAIVTGFGETSTDEFPDTLATTAFGDAPPGDEDIRQQVVEALRSDAATIDLVVDVIVRNGVVHLRGRVQTLDDAESAEEVAGRVPTVREVIEELEVAAIE